MIQNTIIYLVGFSGTGKYTIAKSLATLLGAKVIDNHWINNPIFGLLYNDRHTPYPDAIWNEIDKVRDAILETIATLAQSHMNFIFTHAGIEGDPYDLKVYSQIAETAKRRNALFLPVRLICDQSELLKRIGSPERADRLKTTNIEDIKKLKNHQVLNPAHKITMTLDVSDMKREETARLIYERITLMADS